MTEESTINNTHYNRQRFPHGRKIDLYVLRFQDAESQEQRELTPFEELEGWRQGETWDGKEVIVNERHQAGAVRERRGPYLLAWEVHPGEQVVARLAVTLKGDLVVETITEEGEPDRVQTWFEPKTAKCVPQVHDYIVKITSVLGRTVSLGEDGAEGAFGRDALADHLSAYLDRDDRRTLCDCVLEKEWDNDYIPTADEIREKNRRITVKVSKEGSPTQ